MRLPPVIVHNLHVLWADPGPDEADSPLLVDSDAVLACPVYLQRLQPVAWKDTEVVEQVSSVQHHQLSESDPFDLRINTLRPPSRPEALGRGSPKQLITATSITGRVMRVLRRRVRRLEVTAPVRDVACLGRKSAYRAFGDSPSGPGTPMSAMAGEVARVWLGLVGGGG
jgi:hypothetical protein